MEATGVLDCLGVDVLTALGDIVKRGILRLPAAVAALAAIGMTAGVAVYIVVPGGVEEVSPQNEIGTPVACAPILAVNSPEPTTKGVLFNSDEGLSDSERMAKYEHAMKDFQVVYSAWLECVKVGLDKIDLRSLPRYGITVDFAPGAPTLGDAVVKADLVVVGNVTGFIPITTPFSGTRTTLSVDQTLKGSQVSTLDITQGSQVSPSEDVTGLAISEAPNEGLLAPFDRAILLLQRGSDGNYHIQNVSGWFQIVNGLVKANYFNDWRASVEGKTEAEFVDMIKAALQ